jgi:hypothetical protein
MANDIYTSNNTSGKDINYTGKDFNSFRENLIQYAKSYYASTYKDFSENSTGMMFIELASYVGDVLSYYIDHQFKEGFLQHSSERKNIINLANYLGYKIRTSVSATTELDVYQLLPSKIGTNGKSEPDTRYALNIQEGMEISSSDGNSPSFRTINQINFGENSESSPREISIYERDDMGQPTFYLVKKTCLASSGTLQTKTVNVGDVQEFYEVTIPETNVIEILSVTDSGGNIYYEVPYLAQDTVPIEEPNDHKNNPIYSKYADSAPYVLRYMKTSRRFTTIVNPDNTTTLEFGAGSDKFDDEIIIPGLNNLGKTMNTSASFENALDPSNFLKSNSYGSAPSNTTLTIQYYVGGGIESNVAANTLNTVQSAAYSESTEYLDVLDRGAFDAIKSSLRVNNPLPATGGKSTETDEEIRQNGLASFSAQHRAVTREDYVIRTLSMPPKFGSVAKAYVSKDGILDTRTQTNVFKQAFTDETKITPNGMNIVYGELNNPLAINLYVLSYNNSNHLVQPNELIMKNLKAYLSKYRILTDGLNITNAFIINFGINFEISIFHNFNKKEVLLTCINELSSMFSIDKISIMQCIELGEIELALSKVSGVKSVMSVSVKNLTVQDGDYSENEYDIEAATIGKTIYPSMDPSIFELKFPEKDITGRVV